MSTPFRTHRLVEFADTDMAGIAHFSAFFRWMEAAEHELLRSLGLSVYTKLDDGMVISFPRVGAECDYHSPARCEDLLAIDVSVSKIGTTSLSYAFRFSIEGTVIAEGRLTCVCCQILPGERPKPTPLPEEIAEGLRSFLSA